MAVETRLERELEDRRAEIADRKKRIRRLPRGSRERVRLVRAQRKARVRAGVVRAALMRRRAEGRLWGGARAVTNEVIDIVRGRVPITSRKRWATFGNPDSDHHMSQATADAVDFGTAENYELAREIAAKLGAAGEWSGDYDSFTIVRNGRHYRVQMIAGTHGTGPHLHVGVRRA